MAHHGKESEKSPEGLAVPTPHVVACEAQRVDITAAGAATVAAILHLVRLMGAELVLARGHDLAHFEQAVRAKLGEFTSPTADAEARRAGLAHAHHLIEQVLTQIRAQAELKRSLAVGTEKAPEVQSVPLMRPASNLLN